MTAFQLRTDRSESIDPDGSVRVLDWWREDQMTTVQATWDFLAGLAPSAVTLDLLAIAVAVYCADKLALRRDASDGWTRDIHLDVAVSDLDRFQPVLPAITELLRFLTGDRWTLSVRAGRRTMPAPPTNPTVGGDCVCLFSGGLDSLCGAIDLLHGGAVPVLLGHHEGGIVAHAQTELHERLTERFAANVALRQLLLTPRTGTAERPLPAEREETTRS